MSYCLLTDEQEQLGIPYKATKLVDQPDILYRLANVVAVLERYFLSDYWSLRPSVNFVEFQHDTNRSWGVMVFIDDGNQLSKRFELNLSGLPIVVGIDLTSYDPFTRHAVRKFLRENFVYVDPEIDPASLKAGHERKAKLKSDYGHCLDLVFVPDGPKCRFAVEDSRIREIIIEIVDEVYG